LFFSYALSCPSLCILVLFSSTLSLLLHMPFHPQSLIHSSSFIHTLVHALGAILVSRLGFTLTSTSCFGYIHSLVCVSSSFSFAYCLCGFIDSIFAFTSFGRVHLSPFAFTGFHLLYFYTVYFYTLYPRFI